MLEWSRAGLSSGLSQFIPAVPNKGKSHRKTLALYCGEWQTEAVKSGAPMIGISLIGILIMINGMDRGTGYTILVLSLGMMAGGFLMAKH